MAKVSSTIRQLFIARGGSLFQVHGKMPAKQSESTRNMRNGRKTIKVGLGTRGTRSNKSLSSVIKVTAGTRGTR